MEQAADAFEEEIYWVRINYQKVNVPVRDTGNQRKLTTVKTGIVEFDELGVYNFTLQPEQYWIQTDQLLVYLKSMRLKPVD